MMQAQFIQGIMKKIAASGHEKTKPIQTQFNPISEDKIERFYVENELYDCFNNTTRGSYHPQGCQYKPNFY